MAVKLSQRTTLETILPRLVLRLRSIANRFEEWYNIGRQQDGPRNESNCSIAFSPFQSPIPPLKGNDVMSEKRDALDDVISKLKQERDELKLKMHLASMDAKDDYERISGKVDELTEQYDPVKDAVEETAENIFSALGLVADELKAGFQRVRKSVSEEK